MAPRLQGEEKFDNETTHEDMKDDLGMCLRYDKVAFHDDDTCMEARVRQQAFAAFVVCVARQALEY
jgi:hypothetical protein